jgi:DNA replication protein DnaC
MNIFFSVSIFSCCAIKNELFKKITMGYQGIMFMLMVGSVLYKIISDEQLTGMIYTQLHFDQIYTALIDKFLMDTHLVVNTILNAQACNVPALGYHSYYGSLPGKKKYGVTFIKQERMLGNIDITTYSLKVNGLWYDSRKIIPHIQSMILVHDSTTVQVLHISTATFKTDIQSLSLIYHQPMEHQLHAADTIVKLFMKNNNAGALLYGPPNTGKTTTAHVLKKLLDKKTNTPAQLYYNFNPSISGVDIATILVNARHNIIIIVINEIDQHFANSLSEQNKKFNPKSSYTDSKQAFSDMIDLIRSTKNVILIGTTNNNADDLSRMYRSFTRKGRFCSHIHMHTVIS